MTSSPESSPVLRRALVAIGGLGFAAAAIALFAAAPNAHADSDAARTSLARSLALLDAGAPTTAERHAIAAVRAQPKWGLAHAVHARTLLALGDGLSADAALQRAQAEGFDMRRGQQLAAHAALLQGRYPRAIELARQADPRFAPYTQLILAEAYRATGDGAAATAALDRALAIAPRDAATWRALADFRHGDGNIGGAIQAAERSLALDPRQVDTLTLRARLVRDQYGLIAALPWFDAALARDPWNHDTLLEKAATLGDAGRTVEMLGTVRAAMRSRPASAQGYYLQAVLAARGGDYALARAMLQRSGPGMQAVPGAQLLAGALDLDAGAYRQAEEKLRPLLAAQPMNLAARRLLATALMRRDASRDAIDLLAPVIERGDADSYSLTLAARAFERIGDRGRAAELFDRAAAPARSAGGAFAPDASIRVLAAEAATGGPGQEVAFIRGLIASGDPVAAARRAAEMIGRDPGVPEPHLLLGDVAMLAGSPRDAVAAYRRAASLRFDEPTMLRLVEAQDKSGDRAGAASTLALFLSQNPVNLAALRMAAHWQIAAGEYDAAIDSLETIRHRIGDGDAVILAELAFAHAALGEHAEARAFGRAAYTLAPTNAAVVDAFGWAALQAGDAAMALELLQKAVRIAPGHSVIRWHLAQAYDAAGRGREAAAAARAALADPNFTDRREAEALARAA